MKNLPIYSFIIFSLLLVSSCAEEVSQEDLVKAAIQMKIDQWQSAQLNDCLDRTYTKAEDYVDSLLLATSLDSKLDTIPKPGKPDKPVKPAFKEKPDSVFVEPIYKEKKKGSEE